MISRFLLSVLLLLGWVSCSLEAAFAQRYSLGQVKSNLWSNDQGLKRDLVLPSGHGITLFAPSSELIVRSAKIVTQLDQSYVATFGSISDFTLRIDLLDRDRFSELDNAPSWANGLYENGVISIGLSAETEHSSDKLERLIKHEYTHAFLDQFTKGNCPLWLDEGLAQWAEGAEDHTLLQLFKVWLRSHKPFSLPQLGQDYTELERTSLPAAYAHSLLGAKYLVQAFGDQQLKEYLLQRRSGLSHDSSFQKSFGISSAAFDQHLQTALINWLEK